MAKEESAAERTTVERTSDRDVTVTREFDAAPAIVFEAWAKPELFRRWWIPKSSGMTIVSCEMDVRTGGGYRIEIKHPAMDKPMAFFGKYLEVVPPKRIVWTNEEGPNGAVTTVTFEEKAGRTLLTLNERYPSKEAFEQNSGSADGLPEQLAQLAALLAEPQ